MDINIIAAVVFGLALVHTFATKFFEKMASRMPRHSGLLHLLGEVEVVFGFWAFVLIAIMAVVSGGPKALEYAGSPQYTEPLFVFVIMVVAASRPVLVAIEALIAFIARLAPLPTVVAQVWLCLALVPIIGSLITEPAAMTLAALMLAPGGVQIFYGDETARPLGPVPDSDPQQGTRSDMNWSSADTTLLSHWRRLGSFRARHVALARGTHRQLADAPYTFSRIDAPTGDRVVVAMNAAGQQGIVVGDTFAEGTPVRDAYSGQTGRVQAGRVTLGSGAGRWVLLERAP